MQSFYNSLKHFQWLHNIKSKEQVIIYFTIFCRTLQLLPMYIYIYFIWLLDKYLPHQTINPCVCFWSLFTSNSSTQNIVGRLQHLVNESILWPLAYISLIHKISLIPHTAVCTCFTAPTHSCLWPAPGHRLHRFTGLHRGQDLCDLCKIQRALLDFSMF